MLVMNSCHPRWTESIGNRYKIDIYDPTGTHVLRSRYVHNKTRLHAIKHERTN